MVGKKIGSFLKYPATIYKRVRSAKNVKFLKGWKYAKYIAFGAKYLSNAKKAKTAALGAKIALRGSNVSKVTNPLGWVLLGVDAIGSFMNYTSDNQAPSWDPKLGGEGDSLKDYGLAGATNIFDPKKYGQGDNITLCWTQNPQDSLSMVLSFVASNSTRTTMNLTKLCDFEKEGFSLFLINSVNSKEIADQMKVSGGDDYSLRILAIKHGVYEEGWQDDNIGCKFLPLSVDPANLPPISYAGHCSYLDFANQYKDSPDQLVVIDKDAPEIFNFHFEDSESNVINVYARRVTDSDINKADEKEINDFFTVQPISSLIGNPEDETKEEREEREKISNVSGYEDEEEKEEKSNESKWYRGIESPRPISSFDHFKILKESMLFEYGDEKKTTTAVEKSSDTEEDKDKPEADSPDGSKKTPTNVGSNFFEAKEIQKRFERIIETQEEPFGFAIYFVEKREYADPLLRDIYQPGTFMNFMVDQDAIDASDGDPIGGGIRVNNMDLLLDVRKGIYRFKEKDEKTTKEEIEKALADSGEIQKSQIGKSKITISPGKGNDTEEKEKPLKIIDRIAAEDLSKLGIEGWDDVTNVKVIKSKSGEPIEVKIKNRKAKFGDKSRKIEKNEPGFLSALKLAKEFEEKKESDEKENRDEK